MRKVPILIAAAATAFLGLAAEAGNHKPGKGQSGGVAGATDCPPGLAKKNPPCLPPGQARKYGRGDIIHGDYRVIGNPGGDVPVDVETLKKGGVASPEP